MRLCMFHPVGRPLERGWVGRIDGNRVVHLAAQTLQHFYTGGASAREHAEYPLDQVVLLAPVPNPPAVRVFEPDGSFAFANPAAIVGPGAAIAPPPGADALLARARLTAIVGAAAAIGGYTLLAEWRAPKLEAPKDRDFALVLGPLVVTRDELPTGIAGDYDWEAARAHAASGTELRTGDLLAAPAHTEIGLVAPGETVELDAGSIGTLASQVVT